MGLGGEQVWGELDWAGGEHVGSERVTLSWGETQYIRCVNMFLGQYENL